MNIHKYKLDLTSFYNIVMQFLTFVPRMMIAEKRVF